jgi:hypothetical protein
MTKKKLAEGMGSVNVETQYDVSSIKRLAGLANETTVAGTVVKESIKDPISADDARGMADDIEEQMHVIAEALESIQMLVRNHLPSEYRYMKEYTFPQIQIALGGYGYTDRMVRSFESLVEDLREHVEDSYNPAEE